MNAPNTSIPAYGQNAQERILWTALFTRGIEGRRGIPLVLRGKPATVKTATVKRILRRAGLHLEVVIDSLRQPQDYLGIPVPHDTPVTPGLAHLDPDGDGSIFSARYASFGFALRSAGAARGCIFFDEANTATPEVQAARLRVLSEGVVGELELGPNVRFILAMNDASDASATYEFSNATSSRLVWLDWQNVSAAQFGGFLAQSGGKGGGSLPVPAIDPIALEQRADELFDLHWPTYAGQVAGFLQKMPGLLLDPPREGSEPGPWPSTRSWDTLAHVLTGCAVFGLKLDEINSFAVGTIGEAAWTAFTRWRAEADLPDPELLLTGKASFTHKIVRLDRTAAVLAACTSVVLGCEDKPKQQVYAGALWALVATMVGTAEDATDLAIPTIITLCQRQLVGLNLNAFKVMGQLESVLNAADIDVNALRVSNAP